MKRQLRAYLTLFLVLAVSQICFGWTTVGDGIEYQDYTISGPNNLFVTRMLRSNTNAIIDALLAKGSVASNQTVPAQYSANDDAVFFDGNDWGPRYSMVAAINGDFYLSGGVSRGIRVSNGWYSSQINTDGSIYGAFGWTKDRETIMSGYPNAVQTMRVTFPDSGLSLSVSGINRAPGDNELCVINPFMGLTTGTDSTVTEVLMQLTSPNLISQIGIIGRVKAVFVNTGSTTIPFDCVVLSAKGSAANYLRNYAKTGSQVKITTTIDSYKTDGTTQIGHKWQNTLAGMSGCQVVLENGIVKDYSSVAIMAARHPRTAIAFNNTYVFFVVCDGRDAGVSIGMTGIELGTFCRNTLGATDALNLDGGGSSTMVVNGTVKNKPSDGSPRAVASSLVMANYKPKQQSTKFNYGQLVSVTGNSVNFRRGPGTIHPAISVQTLGTVGTITYHRLGGIMTKGGYWWNVNFNGVEGWMHESYLAAYGTSAPTITLQPVDQTVCSGVVKLSIEASGSGRILYKWQKDGINIIDGNDYSGTAASTLTISEALNSVGTYRCIVSSSYGGVVSNGAKVSLLHPPVSVEISKPSTYLTNKGPVTYTVSFENAATVSPKVTVNKTGTANASVAQYYISAEQRRITLSNITGNGSISISLGAGSATNGCGLPSAAAVAAAITVDNTAPATVIVLDAGKYTPSRNTLSASWKNSSDENGIASYQYAIGTTTTTTDTKNWTDVGNVTKISDTSLSLAEGSKYYVLVRAVDNAGNVSATAASDGILVAPTVNKIGNAFYLENNIPLALRDKTVTAAKPGVFWIEENDRSAALQIISNSPVAVWDKISIAGCLDLLNGNRVLTGDVMEKSGTSAALAPLGMSINNLGGCDFNALTPGITGGRSLYNIGLLVRCWGKVSGRNAEDPNNKFFYINDGSLASGVLVRCGNTNPPASEFAAVTGIVCKEVTGNISKPVIFARYADDITAL